MQDHQYKRQPRLFGANAFQYRFGIAVGSLKSPPQWEPWMQHDSHDPYYVGQCAKDVKDWVVATEVLVHRHGQMFIIALGGAARRLLDDMEQGKRQFGLDLPDPRQQGQLVRVSVVEFILRVFMRRLLVRKEARMLLAGLDFFKFVPRRDERPEE